MRILVGERSWENFGRGRGVGRILVGERCWENFGGGRTLVEGEFCSGIS